MTPIQMHVCVCTALKSQFHINDDEKDSELLH